jgi:hypothetical protein
MSRISAQLPRSWFGYSERLGPPVGSAISVHGKPGRVASVRPSPTDEHMLDVEVEMDEDPLTGVPGPRDDVDDGSWDQ